MGSLIYESRDASGLYYRRNRYYDSEKGRFTQEDPVTGRCARVLLAAIVCAATGGACGSGEARPGRRTGRDLLDLLREGDTPVTMRIAPLQDTVSDVRTVRIAYLFFNRGAPTDVGLSDAFVGFQVIGPDGRTLERISESPMAETNFPVRHVEIAPNSFTGGIVNLACASRLDAPASDGPQRRCLWGYRFDSRGTYRIVGYYSPISEPGDSAISARSAHRLRADTVIVVVP
jgi:hypothetical protein